MVQEKTQSTNDFIFFMFWGILQTRYVGIDILLQILPKLIRWTGQMDK